MEGQSSRKRTLNMLDFCEVEKSGEMALNVKIDLKNVYSIVLEDRRQQASAFDTFLTTGKKVRLGIKIAKTTHPLMSNVFNLAFGPLNKDGTIDDKARLSYQEYSKVFSTVLLEAVAYLELHPDRYVGIDGSNNTRAYMYYRCIRNNFTYLSTIFTMWGINYYIRMLRQVEDGDCDLDTEDIITTSKTIEAHETIKSEKLYNYFIFNLKSNHTSIQKNN